MEGSGEGLGATLLRAEAESSKHLEMRTPTAHKALDAPKPKLSPTTLTPTSPSSKAMPHVSPPSYIFNNLHHLLGAELG